MSGSSGISQYEDQIAQSAAANNVPLPILQWVLNQEDASGDPDAVNAASGATGLAQALPSTASDPGYGISPFDPTDPDQSINFAGQYLSALYQKTGSWGAAVNAYGTTSGSPSLQSEFNSLLQSTGIDSAGFDTGYANGESGLPNGAPAGPTSGEQVPSYGNNLSGFLSEIATRAALVVLGLICFMGGFVLLGRESGIAGYPAGKGGMRL